MLMRSSEINDRDTDPYRVVIVGAGPAGLTAASELTKANIETIVLEKDDIVGGISRTVTYDGYHFDIGGHRFFTKIKLVEDMWHKFVPNDFLLRERTSRILYNQKFFNYPLKVSNALSGLGIRTSVLVALSYIRARLFPVKNERSFEDFVSNRFGKHLYRIFFKTYTEKVWGIPCTEISAEWAAQRIKGLSLFSALKNAVIGNRFATKRTVVKSLIDSFHYPRLGPGMMWENVTAQIRNDGNQVQLETDVTKITWSDNTIRSVEVTKKDGEVETISGTHFISTMPVRELIQKLEPRPPKQVLEAAAGLNYRDFLTVALIVDREHMFTDNWIYIHDQGVKVGRIQNFKNWSPEMVPDPSKTCLGLEYFCFEGDGLWTMADEDLVELGKTEMEALGFLDAQEVEDGTVVRMPKAYPVYDDTYADHLQTIRHFLDHQIHNIQLVGRNGMHKYNNQDHSMLTAILAVENILGANNDLWSVNTEQEYHEEVSENAASDSETSPTGPVDQPTHRQLGRPQLAALAATQPRVPRRLKPHTDVDAGIYSVFARLDKFSFAAAFGIITALYIFIPTMWLTVQGGPNTGQHITLLSQFFYGYEVSPTGAVIGGVHGFFSGFVVGWLIAYLRNLTFALFFYIIVRRAESDVTRKLLDYI